MNEEMVKEWNEIMPVKLSTYIIKWHNVMLVKLTSDNGLTILYYVLCSYKHVKKSNFKKPIQYSSYESIL